MYMYCVYNHVYSVCICIVYIIMYIVYVYVLCMVNGKGIILLHICSIKYINDGRK